MKRIAPRTPARSKSNSNESLQVFCRLRPKSTPNEVSCVEVISPTTVSLRPPESLSSIPSGTCKEYQYTFKRVFAELSTQKELFDEIALPLVEQLIQGRNGLLFTYGVTGSGKTYTMTGAKHNLGIVPRCLDVLFNSINGCLAEKCIFKPDRMNGFDVQNECDARKDRNQSDRKDKFGGLKKKGSYEDLSSSRSREGTKVGVEEDNAYAVFVSYVEIYNKIVYDLLEDIGNKFRDDGIINRPQSKIIREDAAHNMYVHGVTEVEVENAQEAFDVFNYGRNHKKMAQTSLNSESSRSHSIFTIRLVQAPLTEDAESVLQEKKFVAISQLSLVDLAGSERTNRTGNKGTRLREAGNINNSLMTLRNCLEMLRENQANDCGKIIPYRDSKLTHLFKNFFEGEGSIRMIVCVNPRFDDYEENVQVMKFAEASQEVLVKPITMRSDLPIGFTPGRRRANQEFKEKIKEIIIKGNNPAPFTTFDGDNICIYSLDPFPTIDDADSGPESNKKLISFLEGRIKKKNLLRADLMAKIEKFRASLRKSQEDSLKLRQENEAANARLEQKDAKMRILEEKVISMDKSFESLKRKYDERSSETQRLKWDNEQKTNMLSRYDFEKNKEKEKTKKMAAKTDRLTREKENTLKEKEKIEMQLKLTETRIRRVQKAVDMNGKPLLGRKTKIPKIHEGYNSDTESSSASGPAEAPIVETPQRKLRPRVPPRTIAVSDRRYGNPQCNLHDQWLVHKPAILAPTNTVLQPQMKRRKSVTNVTSPEELKKTSKYCLITQNQESDGNIETHLHKAGVVPTAGGGAQVIFHDTETLTQTSPCTSPRKRILDELNELNKLNKGIKNSPTYV